MELTFTYIISQMFLALMYIFLGLSYYAKNRKSILIYGILAQFANILAYIFLGAWTGLAMVIVSIIQNIIFIIDENKNGKRENINKQDYIILIALYIFLVTLTIFTFDGFLSLLSVFATALYFYSVTQKRPIVYKFLGIISQLCWLGYNIYIQAIIGIILEFILLICTISGYLIDRKKQKI